MIQFFSNHKIIFKFINLIFVIFYLSPGSLTGLFVYNDLSRQPQITPDFFNVSSNHFYVFIIISVLWFLTFYRSGKLNFLVVILILYSVILEILHMVIPNRTFQNEDLFGNLFGVIVTIVILYVFRIYEKNKKS